MINIHIATSSDLPSILSLLKQNGLPQDGLAQHLSKTFVAYHNDRLVGCVALEHYGAYALLRSLAVAQPVRGLGIGKQLVEAGLSLAKTLGVTQIYLLTQTAHEFFARFFHFSDIERNQIPIEVTQSVEFTTACPQSAQAMMLTINNNDFISAISLQTVDMRSEIKDYYTKRITDASPCCSASINCSYETNLLAELPAETACVSFGCGDPISLANLKPGEVVLDLGSGSGLDCFLAAKRVGERGRVIGVDMTSAMLERARQAAERLNLPQVEFKEGLLEDLPIEDNSIDVIISNCVLNLSLDKPVVFKEMARVLKRGGRLAISDILSKKDIPPHLRQDPLAWSSCASGALTPKELEQALQQHGFTQIHITSKGEYDSSFSQFEPGMLFSAHISAVKP